MLNHLKDVKLPYSTKKIRNKKIYELINSDKKNINKSINLILLKKIGSAYYKRRLSINKVKNLAK